MTDPSEGWMPEPTTDWWLARPGRLLRRAYEDLALGITSLGLDHPEQPPDSALDAGHWAKLQQAYAGAMQVAGAACSLLAPSKGISLYAPPTTERCLDADVARALYEINQSTGREAADGPGPCDSITHPAAPYHVFVTTLLLEVVRLLPGISKERMDEDFSPTVVKTDQALVERVEALVGHLARSPAERSSRYLRLVSRCYLLGLVPELAVMARAAVEAALEDVGTDESIRQRVGGKHAVGLGQRIEYCRSVGIFDSTAYKSAMRLKDDGDDTVHNVPQHAPPADETLMRLMTVLRALECHAGSGDSPAG
jgi:hypothetical protein